MVSRRRTFRRRLYRGRSVFERYRNARRQREFLEKLMNQEPTKTVFKKARATGMSSQITVVKHRSVGPSWPPPKTITIATDLHLDDGSEMKWFHAPHQTGMLWECKCCGYRYRWKDYTKYRNLKERDRKYAASRCIRCNSRDWKARAIDNEFDRAIARMNGELV